LDAAINLLNGGFYSARTHRANVVTNVVVIIDNAVAMSFQIVTEVISLMATTIDKEGLRRSNIAFPEEIFCLP
jgi:hypothetical protein